MSDLISKNQSLTKWKEDFKDFVEGLDMPRDDYKGIMEYIDEVPSAEPRKKGKWIFIHPLQKNDLGAYMCSVCEYGDWDIKPTDKYCKFCGADMREGEQE